MALTLAELKKFMDETTNKKLDRVDVRLGQIESSVSGNARRLDEQAVKIQANQASIAEIKAEVDRLREGPLPVPVEAAAAVAPSTPRRSPAEEGDYARARRSLRFWPIPGADKDSLWDAAGVFMGTNLGLKGRLNQTKIEAISRVEIPSGPGVKHEALVRFTDIETRDMVIGAASMLARYIDDNGRPTAGMRIEVPAHLRKDFRLLFKFGQTLRTRHGKGVRRHVKFDDSNGSLFLNVRLPGDDSWSRVSTELARRGLRTREAVNNRDLEARFDLAGPDVDRPRPASVSTMETAPSTSSESGASVWTARRPDSVSS